MKLKVMPDKSMTLMGLIDEYDDRDVGRLQINLPEPGETTASIWSVYIDPDYRGRGYGMLLMVEALMQLKKQCPKTKRVWLYVARANERAVKLYRTIGFVDSPGNNNDKVSNLVMELALDRKGMDHVRYLDRILAPLWGNGKAA